MTRKRLFVFRTGIAQATVYESGTPAAPRLRRYRVELLAGEGEVDRRLVFRASEADDVWFVLDAAHRLVTEYLAAGATFEQWCADHGFDPADREVDL